MLVQGSTGLTPRELEVACLVAEGWSQKRVADSLGISPKTVESHLENIAGKLDGNGRRKVRITRFVMVAHSTHFD